MKKYLLVRFGDLYMRDEISKRDLIDCLERSVDHLINTVEGTYFDPKKNEWVKIQEI